MFFNLRKTSTIHIELLFRNAPGKVHELTFLWFALPGPLLIVKGEAQESLLYGLLSFGGWGGVF